MDKLSAMRAFVAVVEDGGFAAAARTLGLSRSVVSRQVIQLEQSLRTQLLTRNTRNVAPTETGLAYYERCRTILADIEAAELGLLSETGAPAGILKVNAPMSFGVLHLSSAVSDFMTLYPEVSVLLKLDDQRIDPIAEGFDVTIRIGTLEDSTLIARRIAPATLVLAASPEFIARHGPIEKPDDLATLPCLHYGHISAGSVWHLDGPRGAVNATVRGRFASNNGDVLAEAASHGHGICLIPTFIAAPYLKDGRLIAILDAYPPRPLSISALYAPTPHVAPKVRAFIDFMVTRFGKSPIWDL